MMRQMNKEKKRLKSLHLFSGSKEKTKSQLHHKLLLKTKLRHLKAKNAKKVHVLALKT